MLFVGYGAMQFFIYIPVACIKTTIPDHFIMLFRDMSDETLYEFHNRDSFFHIGIIFMSVVMKGNKVTIILIDSGGGNDRPAKIASNIFYDVFWIAFVWLSIDIEAMFVFPVTLSFYLFKGRADLRFQFIKESGTESITEKSVVKMIHVTPGTVIAVAAFGNETMDVRIPFKVPAKGMQNHDKTRGEIHGFVLLNKHAGNNTVYSMEEAVKKGAVM